MGDARLAALRLLNRRDYTRAELRERLLAREMNAADVDEALDGMGREGLIDDRRVAAAHTRTASTIKGRGRLRVARELEARGIDKSVVQETIAALAPDDEADAIRRFLSRRNVPRHPIAAEHRRLFAQLLRRGFPSDVIAKVMRERRDGTE